MSHFHDLIGIEQELARVNWALRQFSEELAPPIVGGYHITCSDEAEWECAEAFQQWFAQVLLPPLKPARRALFRSTNLGARYEWGAIRVAEHHYATAETRNAFKLLVIKINSHAAVRPRSDGGLEYGLMDRYDCESACCGALNGLLKGVSLPAFDELAKLFRSGNVDRLAILRDQSIVPLYHRALLAAIINARLQAAQVVLDIEQNRPNTSTICLILPCVTINKPGPDTELLLGVYGIDWTEESAQVKYQGLGDMPDRYNIVHERGRLRITDDCWSPGTAS